MAGSQSRVKRMNKMSGARIWKTFGIAFVVCSAIWVTMDAAQYSVKDVYPLPRAYVFGLGINSRGEVVGYAQGIPPDSVLEHGFVSSNGVVTDFATLPAFEGWTATWAYAINSTGQVAGEGDPPSGDRAFFYSAGQVTQFGGGGARARAINDLGQVAGWRSSRAFLYSGGVLTELGTLGGSGSYARGINAAGQIVGSSWTTNGQSHAFLYAQGQMRDLGTLGGPSSDAHAINAAGQIVGYSTTADGASHAFLYSHDQMLDLGTLGGTGSLALAVNANGDVVGSSATTGLRGHAFLYSNGQMTDLNALIPANTGWELQTATGINDAGQIVGMGDYTWRIAAYLLTPVPLLTDPALSNGIFRVSVPTAPATTYILEYSDSLVASNWTALPQFTGDGTTKVLKDPSAPALQRFYRLRMQ
jgi:probable HAF family extracellular repeat protein